jgi:hypothetical protein
MKKILCLFSILMLASVVCQGAIALQLGSVTGTWTGTTGGSKVVGIGSNEVRWGDPATINGQSGLRFDGAAPPAIDLNLNQAFILGDITHYNNPVYSGTASTEAFLKIDLFISNASTVHQDFNFTFGINETPNIGTPQQQADIIYFPTAFPNESFQLDGDLLTLQLLGFGPSAGTIINTFSSLEGNSNQTRLWAQVTQASVPEPETVLLMGIGFVALGMIYRKKFK